MQHKYKYIRFLNFSLKQRRTECEKNRKRTAPTPLVEEFALYRQERVAFFKEKSEREKKKLEIYENFTTRQTSILEKLAEKWLNEKGTEDN